LFTKEPDDRTADVGTILRGLRRLEKELGERTAATARPAEIPAATKTAPLTAGANTSADRCETRLVIDEPRTKMREPDCGAPIVVLAVAIWLSVLWPHFSAQILGTKSAFAIAPEQPYAIGPPTSEDLAKGEPTSLATAPEPAASAEVAVSTATLESGRSVGTVATTPVVKTAPRSTMTHVKQTRAKTGGGLPPNTARLTLAVSPWGSVYIDGKFHGATPPVTTLDLSPGRHLVEVRNSSQATYLTYATIRAGEVRSIRHEFETGHEFR
jgi:hypothetical protein